MSVSVENATVYRAAGRRFFTKRAALDAHVRLLQSDRLRDNGETFWSVSDAERDRLNKVKARFVRRFISHKNLRPSQANTSTVPTGGHTSPEQRGAA